MHPAPTFIQWIDFGEKISPPPELPQGVMRLGAADLRVRVPEHGDS